MGRSNYFVIVAVLGLWQVSVLLQTKTPSFEDIYMDAPKSSSTFSSMLWSSAPANATDDGFDIQTYDAPSNSYDYTAAPSIQKASNDSSVSDTTSSIRKWGCHRTETPTIFVHIGKAGGGVIRTRLAGAAQNVSRPQWHDPAGDNHYYPISSNTTVRRGKFCNSKNKNAKIPTNNATRPLIDRVKTFEGDFFCNATTPFGMAVACPSDHRARRQNKYTSSTCLGCNDEYYLEPQYYDLVQEDEQARASSLLLNPPNPSHICDTVYVSHNLFGAELSWLPPRYLKEYWWDNSPWRGGTTNSNAESQLEKYWAGLLSDRNYRAQQVLEKLDNSSLTRLYSEKIQNQTSEEEEPKWCPDGYIYQNNKLQYHRSSFVGNEWEKMKHHYTSCTKPIGEAADGVFREFWKEQPKEAESSNSNGVFSDQNNYSPVYASMPLHRITMIREPFSWILSKFFWDSKVHRKNSCQDIFFSTHENPTMSWVENYSYQYLMYLCGTDCDSRFENKMMGLDGIEAQAKSNLRNAFSVVGLLHESDSFYEMIHKRIDYLDMNRSYPIELKSHQSAKTKQKPLCLEQFLKNETFREYVRSNTPAFAALERVYQVGVEVNRFQKEELSQCESKR